MGKKSSQKKQQKNSKQQSQPQAARRSGSPLQVASLGGTPTSAAMPAMNMSTKASAPSVFGEQTQYVRGDIAKILFLLLIVSILLAILVVLGEKTLVLQNAGQSLARFLKLD